MKTPHKYAALIKAWADGAEIEWQYPANAEWKTCDRPAWREQVGYRIKPEQEPDVVLYFRHCVQWWGHETVEDGDNTKATFNGETGKLIKLEMVS